ncbi:MAG: guanylate kinase [Bacillus sp. (in: Bacteria)]|nr:guanylate kinase [Bacillus sp. (in: firmicutes)]MCM1425138.1 guanylate kinase [Eubacterium sp.]
MKREGILIVVSGFSGAGKGTLMKKLIQEYDNYALSISATTRAPRPGEEDGREYFFISREAFEEKIAEDGLLEYASYCDNYYGTPKDYVQKNLSEGKNVILEIEIQGALKIKKKYPDALLLFVMPPDAKELKRRLMMRGTETQDVIQQRMERAVKEAEGIEEYDYIVINDDLDTCVKELHEIILAAANTPLRNKKFIENIRTELESFAKGEK